MFSTPQKSKGKEIGEDQTKLREGEGDTCVFANTGHQPSPTRHFFVTSKFNMFSVSYTDFSLLT